MSREERTIEVETLGESGFHLKTGGCGEWAGHKHGSWKGSLHVDGEYIADCSDDENLPKLGTIPRYAHSRPRGDAVGYGIAKASSAAYGPSRPDRSIRSQGLLHMTELSDNLTAWLTQVPADDLRIEGLDRVEFGHSAEMMVLTIQVGADSRDVVLRLRSTAGAA
jgi:hypothetical protein